MKGKMFLALLISALIVVSPSAYASTGNKEVLVDPDGTLHGQQIGVKPDGKPIYEELDSNVSAAEKEWIAKKNAMVDVHEQYMKQTISKSEYINQLKSLGADQAVLNAVQKPASSSKSVNELSDNSLVSPDAASATSNYITDLYQQPQQTTYWCGPATASAVIQAKVGGSYSQSSLTSSLHCTADGTPWYDGSYPMENTLNNRIGNSWYTHYGTSVDADTFRSHVILDIDADYGVAANAWEVPGGPHLTGHPQNSTIYHWIAIDGYSNSGNSIHYADSVHGSSISWASSVPAYSSIDYETMATIMDGRGIVW